MENNEPKNPLAFPCTDCETFATDGMTLRDYFAAKALQGIISAQSELFANGGQIQINYCVQESFIIADAMLKERNK